MGRRPLSCQRFRRSASARPPEGLASACEQSLYRQYRFSYNVHSLLILRCVHTQYSHYQSLTFLQRDRTTQAKFPSSSLPISYFHVHSCSESCSRYTTPLGRRTSRSSSLQTSRLRPHPCQPVEALLSGDCTRFQDLEPSNFKP